MTSEGYPRSGKDARGRLASLAATSDGADASANPHRERVDQSKMMCAGLPAGCFDGARPRGVVRVRSSADMPVRVSNVNELVAVQEENRHDGGERRREVADEAFSMALRIRCVGSCLGGIVSDRSRRAGDQPGR